MRKLTLSTISTILDLITVTGCGTTLKTESMEMKQQQALIIHLKMSDEEFGTDDDRAELYNIEEQLRKAIDDKSAG